MTPIRAVLYAAKSTEDRHGSIPTQLDDGREGGGRRLHGCGTAVRGAFRYSLAPNYQGEGGQTTDQRGLSRTVNYPGVPKAVGGDNSDIGAFELQAP